MTDTTAALILDGLAGLDVEDESGDFPSPEVRLALGSIFAISMFVGSLTTFSMVCHLMRRRSSAINNLILLEQTVNSANLPVLCITLARVTFPEWSNQYISHYPICISAQWLVVLALLNRSYGSLGIAIFRVLYVKAQSTILSLGEMFFLRVIAGTGFTLIFVLTNWHILENYFLWNPKVMILWNFCMKTEPKIYMQPAYIDQVGLVFGLVANLIEFTCYFVLFSHLHGHNQNSAINVLKASVFKSRQQKNAITAIGHFFTLVVQTVVFGSLVFLHCFNQEDSGVATWFFVHLIPSLNYALFPLVETLTSDELRRNLLATVGMRSRQTLPTPCGQLGACPEVYNINEASQHILSIADNQFWQSKKLRKGNQSESDSERPKQSSVAQQLSSVAQQSLVLESHF